MPTPKKGPRLGGSAKHHNMMMSNLATELFRHGRITTTKARAKNVQPLAERMVTFAKRGDLHARRQVLTVIRDKDVVHKLFADIGPASAERNGGYTRVVKLGPRKGDGAEMAMIELVDISVGGDEHETLAEAPRRRWSLRRRRGATLSSGAREREEAILAAEDAGGPTDEAFALGDDDDAEAAAAAEAVAAGRITERTLSQADGGAQESRREDETEVSPEDVAARLGVADEEIVEEAEAEAEEAAEDVAEVQADAANEEAVEAEAEQNPAADEEQDK